MKNAMLLLGVALIVGTLHAPVASASVDAWAYWDCWGLSLSAGIATCFLEGGSDGGGPSAGVDLIVTSVCYKDGSPSSSCGHCRLLLVNCDDMLVSTETHTLA